MLRDEDGAGVELSILIVSFNTRDVTLECLESVFANLPSVSTEVIVLDNASGDGSAEAIAQTFPNAKLIAHPDNCGFAQGNNIAAGLASGRRLLLLNPDTIVFPGSLQALWDFAEETPDRKIWGGRTLFEDGTLNPTSCWQAITLWSLFCSAVGLTMAFPRSALFNPETFGNWQRDSIRSVDIVTGCFLLTDQTLWTRLGGFDETFFMYAEEADLCLRARAIGARPAITPAAEIVHLGGRSESSAVEKVIKVHRGRITLIRKHWTPWKAAVGLQLYRFWAWSRMLASHVVAGPRDMPGASAQKWGVIWARRAEWLAGYPVTTRHR